VAATWLPARPRADTAEPTAPSDIERDLEAAPAGQRSPAS